MRINAYPSVSTPSSSDVFVIDGSNGTKSISVDALKNYISQGMGSSSGASNAKAYITQTGQSGKWYYRLWSDGMKECWIPGASEYANESGAISEHQFSYPVSYTHTPAAIGFCCTAGDIQSYTAYVGVAQAYIKLHSHSTVSGNREDVFSCYAIGY